MKEINADAVVISSRVRLARNYRDLPFPSRMNEEAAKISLARTEEALEGADYQVMRMQDLDAQHRQALVENHLISKEAAVNQRGAAVFLSPKHDISVMVNEEDHLRIQTLLPGAQLSRAAELARVVDDGLEKKVQYAFDEQLGYLTCCPTNTGSGMRASEMLHLPALTITGQMPSVTQQIAKLGLTIRGLYGEGTEAQGNLYQVSNQVTLGRTEQELVDAISALCGQLSRLELEQQQALLKKDETAVRDRMMRSYGLLRHARLLETGEFMQRWSDVRMAMLMGLLTNRLEEMDDLLTRCQPANLLIAAGRDMSSRERDAKRADMVRQVLQGIEELQPAADRQIEITDDKAEDVEPGAEGQAKE